MFYECSTMEIKCCTWWEMQIFGGQKEQPAVYHERQFFCFPFSSLFYVIFCFPNRFFILYFVCAVLRFVCSPPFFFRWFPLLFAHEFFPFNFNCFRRLLCRSAAFRGGNDGPQVEPDGARGEIHGVAPHGGIRYGRRHFPAAGVGVHPASPALGVTDRANHPSCHHCLFCTKCPLLSRIVSSEEGFFSVNWMYEYT